MNYYIKGRGLNITLMTKDYTLSNFVKAMKATMKYLNVSLRNPYFYFIVDIFYSNKERKSI